MSIWNRHQNRNDPIGFVGIPGLPDLPPSVWRYFLPYMIPKGKHRRREFGGIFLFAVFLFPTEYKGMYRLPQVREEFHRIFEEAIWILERTSCWPRTI
jgi:hypothetical protein